jgi:hypothetical protein
LRTSWSANFVTAGHHTGSFCADRRPPNSAATALLKRPRRRRRRWMEMKLDSFVFEDVVQVGMRSTAAFHAFRPAFLVCSAEHRSRRPGIMAAVRRGTGGFWPPRGTVQPQPRRSRSPPPGALRTEPSADELVTHHARSATGNKHRKADQPLHHGELGAMTAAMASSPRTSEVLARLSAAPRVSRSG